MDNKAAVDLLDKQIKELEAAKNKLQGVKTTEVIFVIDRSGSMDRLKNDMNVQIKNLLEEQEKANPNSTVSIYTFDNTLETLCEGVNIKERPAKVEIVPRGGTALYDALGQVLNRSKTRITDQKLVNIITDGEENSSREYRSSQVKELVSSLEKQGYTFVYLGADQDVWGVTQTLVLNMNTSMLYNTNAKSVTNMTRSMGTRLDSYMTSGVYCAFSEEERMAAQS